jgi:hypothetical protein
MRTILLASILALGLLAAPVAFAARGGDHGAPSGVADKPQASDHAAGNATHAGPLASLLAAMEGVRDGCRDTTVDHANMTGAETRSWAHCIRDGYHALFESIHWRHHEAKAARLDAKLAKGD